MIPDYQTLMLPLLELANDEGEHRFRDAVECLANKFGLSEQERSELLPSGTQAVFNNRVGWARTYLKQAGLLESPRRGFFRISEQGKSLLARRPDRVDNSVLESYEEFRDFKARKKSSRSHDGKAEDQDDDQQIAETPEDALANAYRKLRSDIESELLENVMQASPAFFERLVVYLLVRMGYGGDQQDAARAVGRSGDGGIDGIIKEDQLGLDVIYIQAKRWEANVGRPEVQKFAGALQGQRARKGIIITTSAFTADAVEYAGAIDSKIILIDGPRLAKLMVDYDVGVSSVGTYEVKKIDTDYFDEG